MNTKKHICIIVDTLSEGGAEKIAASFSFALETEGYKVSIISLRNQITYKYTGKLYNLGDNESPIKWLKQLQKIRLFRSCYKSIDADYYVDFRMRNRFVMEALLHLFVFKPKKMIMSVHNFNIEYHIPRGFIFKYLYHKTKAIVAVSKDSCKALKDYHDFNNLIYIPNFINKERLIVSENIPQYIPSNAVLAIGRLNVFVKQFDKLILSYKNTESFTKGMPLIILGEGRDREILETIIADNNLQERVKLLGFVQNPYDYIKHCKFLVLCSKFEGMPIVILEALALGTPVISFDCKSGPSELIRHKHNGLLIEDQNFKALEQGIDLLQMNGDLYEQLKENASSSIESFTEKQVITSWEAVFN